MSLMKSMNINGELGSPCFSPMCESKKPDSVVLYLMQDFTVLYIDLSALTSLELTFSDINLCHKKLLSILSNAFS